MGKPRGFALAKPMVRGVPEPAVCLVLRLCGSEPYVGQSVPVKPGKGASAALQRKAGKELRDEAATGRERGETCEAAGLNGHGFIQCIL